MASSIDTLWQMFKTSLNGVTSFGAPLVYDGADYDIFCVCMMGAVPHTTASFSCKDYI